MKKYIFGIFIGIIAFFTITNVSAQNEYPETSWEIPKVEGEIVVKWRDYGDRNNNRPNKITVSLLNHETSKTIRREISKNDVEIVKVDKVTTEWHYKTTIYTQSNNEGFSISGVKGIEYPYRLRNYSGILGQVNDQTGDTLEIVIDSALDKYVTYTEHWDDDNRRDGYRLCGLSMVPQNNDLEENRFLSCSEKKNTYIDENTCQLEIHIPYPYPILEDGPDFNNPTKFKYTVYDRLDNYNYQYEVDEDGNIDVYITHEPYKIKDSQVKIIWEDDKNNSKRPNEITIDIYNHEEKENSIILTKKDNWQKTITDLYKNYRYGKASDYSLKIKDTDEYKFKIDGNVEDGYTIIATSTKNKPSETIKNPETSDSLLFYITVAIISSFGLFYSIKKLKNN